MLGSCKATTLFAVSLLLSVSAQATYINVFNLKGESGFGAEFRTDATLTDMLNNANQIATFAPVGGNQASIVGSAGDLVAFSVSEPTTFALLGLGLIELARQRKHKERSTATT